jgi:chemotaxis-related protein WspB
MLFLQFQLGKDRYALDAGRVVEVLPLVELRRLPQSPPGVAGMLNYRGQPVPALDLCQLFLQRPAREAMSTRIIIVRSHDDQASQPLLGLIAEHATNVFHRDPNEFTSAGIKLEASPYLGPVAVDADGMIQWIDHDRLLPEHLREALQAQALLPAPDSLDTRTPGASAPTAHEAD